MIAQQYARRHSATCGFAVFELLIILMLIALTSAVLFSRSPGSSEARTERVFSSDLKALLVQARANAIRSNAERVVRFNGNAIQFEFDDRSLSVPASMSVSVTAADVELKGDNTIGIRFFPNGRSSGGEIQFNSRLTGRTLVVNINWLTSAVTMLEGVKL
jgi:general secretion pathway protein H